MLFLCYISRILGNLLHVSSAPHRRAVIPTRSIWRQSRVIFLTQILGLGTSMLISRWLGPEGRGAFSLVLLLPDLLLHFGRMGLAASLIYFLGKKQVNPHEASGIAVWSSLGLGGGLFLLWLLLKPLTDSWFPGAPAHYLFWTMAFLPLQFWMYVGGGVLQGQGFVEEVYEWQSLSTMAFVIGGAVTILTGADPFRGIFISWAISIIGLSAGLLRFFISHRTFSIVFSLAKIPDILRYGLKGHLGTIVQFLHHKLDIILVGSMLGIKEVGWYTLAAAIAETVWSIPQALATVLFPTISASSHESAISHTRAVLPRVMLIVLAQGGFIFFIAPKIIPAIFGDAFAPSISALQILLPGVCALSILKILSSHLFGTGYPFWNTAILAFGSGVNLLLNWFFIPRFGINGAALSSSCSYTLTTIIMIAAFLKLSGLTLRKIFVFHPSE